MLVPLSWLRDFAPFGTDVDLLVDTLNDLGLVVEGVQRLGEGLEDVVVARIDQIDAIKGADRIRLITVEAGQGPLEIVCGASNFKLGDLVPLAPVGAVLPGGFEIALRKMKGVTSNGMLCSAAELGLDTDAAGLMILDSAAEPGVPLMTTLGIEPDVVFDLAIEGNRPDAWCVSGVARDLAARLGLAFTFPESPLPPAGSTLAAEAVSVTLQTDRCGRFVAAVLEGVVVGPSPAWIGRRLEAAGMRSINNVVDASNYVMLELGQPTHPYDLDQLDGSGFIVREALAGEKLETLDGTVRTLGEASGALGDSGRDCVICDAGNVVMGVGGIMGGAASEITATTTRVALEAAWFDPIAIATTAKRLGLRTEASARFEKGCDPGIIERAIERIVSLLAHSMPTLVPAAGLVDVRGALPEPLFVLARPDRINALLGSSFTGEEMAALLAPLGFVTTFGREELVVAVPSNRPDIRAGRFGEIDLAEEVARCYGYSHLPRRHPQWPQPGRLTSRQHARRMIKEVMCGLGCDEVWTPSFLTDQAHRDMGLDDDGVHVVNPLVANESVLRRSLIPGMVGALVFNRSHRNPAVRFFEVGHIFPPPSLGGVDQKVGSTATARTVVMPDEREMLGALFALEGDDARHAYAAWQVVARALRLGPVRFDPSAPGPGCHPSRTASIVTSTDAVIGRVGELDADVLAALGAPVPGRVGYLEVDLGLLFDPEVTPRLGDSALAPSHYPSTDIDLAFVLDDAVAAADLEGVVRAAGGELLESITLFDVYRGPGVGAGSRSLALRLRFCALDRTLTDAEMASVRTGCIEAAARLGAVLR